MIKSGDLVLGRNNNKYGLVIDVWDNQVWLITRDGAIYICCVDEVEKAIEENDVVEKLTSYKRVAAIKQGGSTYYYAIYDDGRKYYPGDNVIVSGVANGMVHKIEEIIDAEEAANRMGNKNITAEIISYVDMSAYEERVEKRKAAEKLKKNMDKLIKEMDEDNKYEMYAERNSELKQMLDTYRKLIS